MQPFDSMLDILYAHHHVNQPQQLLALEHLESAIHRLFCQTPSPSPLWTTEFVSLAITNNPRRYKQVLSTYLTFLNKESLIEHHHIQGLADLLNLAQKKWIEKNLYAQIWAALQKHSFLWNARNQDHRALQATLSLWQQILCSFQEQNIELAPAQKGTLTDLLQSYQEQFDVFHDLIGKKSVVFAKQALLRINAQDSLPWVPVAVYLFSAFQNSMAVAAACATASTNFGVSLIGVIPPLISGLVNLGSATAVVCSEVKKKWSKESWYYQLRQLQCLLMGAAFANEEENFPFLINQLMQFDNHKQINIIAHGLLGILTQILKNPFEKSPLVVQQGCFTLLKYYFATVTELPLKVRIFETLFTAVGQQRRDENAYHNVYLTLATTSPETLKQMSLSIAMSQGIVALYQWLELKKSSSASEQEQQSLTRAQTDIINLCVNAFSANDKRNLDENVAGLMCLKLLASIDTLPDNSIINQTIVLLKNQDNSFFATIESLAQIEQQQLALDLQPQSSLLSTAWSEIDQQFQGDLVPLRSLLSSPFDYAPSPSPPVFQATMREALLLWLSAKEILPNIAGSRPQTNFLKLIQDYESELIAHTQHFFETEFQELSKQILYDREKSVHRGLAKGVNAVIIITAAALPLTEFYQQNIDAAKKHCMGGNQDLQANEEITRLRQLNIENRFAQLDHRFLNLRINSTKILPLLTVLRSDASLSKLLRFYSLFEESVKSVQNANQKRFLPQESKQFINWCNQYIDKSRSSDSVQLKSKVLEVGNYLHLMGPLLAFSSEDFFTMASGVKNIAILLVEKKEMLQYKNTRQAIDRINFYLESINPLLEKMAKTCKDPVQQKKIQSWQERIAFYCLSTYQLRFILQQMYECLYHLQNGITAHLPAMQSLPAFRDKIEQVMHHELVLDNIKAASIHQQSIAKRIRQIEPLMRTREKNILEDNHYKRLLQKTKAVFDRRLTGKNYFSDEVSNFKEIVAELNGILNEAFIDFDAISEKKIRNNPSLNLINLILHDYRQKAQINPLHQEQKNEIFIINSL
ncbi:MAG: hypothetical protein K2Q14_01690 [Gammaproteobacteria bacterium]|nr:hypothetical protein [Gammaproteobacteria bacterium]